ARGVGDDLGQLAAGHFGAPTERAVAVARDDAPASQAADEWIERVGLVYIAEGDRTGRGGRRRGRRTGGRGGRRGRRGGGRGWRGEGGGGGAVAVWVAVAVSVAVAVGDGVPQGICGPSSSTLGVVIEEVARPEATMTRPSGRVPWACARRATFKKGPPAQLLV